LSEETEIHGHLVRKRKHTNDQCILDEYGNIIFFGFLDNEPNGEILFDIFNDAYNRNPKGCTTFQVGI